MKILDPGHLYELDSLDTELFTEFHPTVTLRFVKRKVVPGRQETWAGTTNQEVLKVLIDRVRVLDMEVPSPVNQDILYHLRMALALHEARALVRKVEKKELLPELIECGKDGHFLLHR